MERVQLRDTYSATSNVQQFLDCRSPHHHPPFFFLAPIVLMIAHSGETLHPSIFFYSPYPCMSIALDVLYEAGLHPFTRELQRRKREKESQGKLRRGKIAAALMHV